ncbi:SCO1860 family LAETG-anchored protein [Streptomyces sp. ICC4]|uniref:SCO1860 family LAETG-anchored protein n=1 Tax=Streptomyces sp. ICC4 TaxID=2099584 RepID=UPI001EF7A03C|nr:SCO1860 family LAETG-anchored protein [Streptomyces sp. ICC4]
MNSNTFRMPVAALFATGAVALLAAPPASATGSHPGEGKASAVVLRTGLDVRLLNKTVQIPLKATLNEVSAPADAAKTALTVTLDGVEGGRPVSVLRADVATSKATADKSRAEAEANLAKARVHVPGLPALSLIEVEKVTSKAVCAAGEKPVATSNVLGAVTVLGKRVTLSAGGPTKVEVPEVGLVSLELSATETTSTTAAATALRLKVSVNPLHLNVAEVDGEVVLADRRGAGLVHGVRVERPREPEHGAAARGVDPGLLGADAVGEAAPDRGEPRVEAGGGREGLPHPCVVRRPPGEAPAGFNARFSARGCGRRRWGRVHVRCSSAWPRPRAGGCPDYGWGRGRGW